jgi:hypothetical protein
MSTEIPIEKRFKILVEISRASHFAWREAVARCCPGVNAQQLVNEMWRVTGEQTGVAYLKHFDVDGDIARQLGASIVWSSQCMGEDAVLEESETPGEYLVRHRACPWHRWHENLSLLPEDRPGCDQWFESVIRTINQKLGSKLCFETLSALPDGDDCCLRRVWQSR